MIVTEACWVGSKTVSHEAKSLKSGEKSEIRARVAGSIVSIHRMRTLALVVVRDRVGDLQFALSRDELGRGRLIFRAGKQVHERDSDRGWELVDHLSPGDDIVGEGVIARSRTDSPTLWVDLLEKL